MNATTFTERYILAVTRAVPEKQRDDVAAELRASIADQIDARMEAGMPAADAEREVLLDLGAPDELAAGYADRPLHLVGPRYYLDWLRLLKLLLAVVLPCAAFGIALGQVLSGAEFGPVVGSTVSGVLSVGVHLAFWVTLIFVLLERYGARPPREETESWSLDGLPQPRETGATFGDMLSTLIFLALGAAAILWDLNLGFVPGENLSFLDPGLWPGWVTGLFVVMALEGALAVIVHVTGRWTVPLAVVNAVLGLAFAVPALWLLFDGALLNPAFFPTVVMSGDGAEVHQILSVIAGFGIVGVTLWDIIDAFRKARR
ncbi:hypothetical protein FVP74_08180 [Microbacterium saccharophilum]|uniref:Uncharacterized protein n=1 Tax=Microbacterium saccharophilum TaxID=1213358 RepID=A0A5C8I181_9MICO|nr:permease prefix domain 1-containing protein [Microbacterium saccharophilum]TXK11312.1 hypothetical protein FVP74_08180 [Microbacterium saccharophilum]GEP48763.1 hypothetical protein MSA03_22710 [Microbacterium saccharophilum]